MQFIDELKIQIQGGKGGNGVIRFNLEFGPSGGNGGDGGNVIFNVTHNCNTLSHLTQFSILKAKDGSSGQGNDCANGKNGKDFIVQVPIGTIVKDIESGKIIFDLKKEGYYVIAKGGKGGRGNASFVTNKNKSPRVYEYGLPGEHLNLELEVRILADCGIIGFPSSGKSTFISIISKAKPQIAPYPFTTLSPVIGMINHKGIRFALADLPGLIEDASLGKGLGIKFLRHATRCKALLHFVPANCENYLKQYLIIRRELKKFSKELALKKEIVCISMADLGIDKKNYLELKKIVKEVILISSFTRMNVNLVLDKILQTINTLKEKSLEKKEDEITIIDLNNKDIDKQILIKVEKEKYYIYGKGAENLVLRCPLDTEDNIRRFNYLLETKKVFHKLKKLGWTMNNELYLPFNISLVFVDGLLQLKPL